MWSANREVCPPLIWALPSSDPVDWNTGNVQKWLLWTEHLYKLPPVGQAFQQLDGKDLCAMSPEDFHKLCPEHSDTLHAHLDIWKSGSAQQRCGSERKKGVQSEPLTLRLKEIKIMSCVRSHLIPMLFSIPSETVYLCQLPAFMLLCIISVPFAICTQCTIKVPGSFSLEI